MCVGWKLTTSGRYAHCEEYVTRAALATGMLHVVRYVAQRVSSSLSALVSVYVTRAALTSGMLHVVRY